MKKTTTTTLRGLFVSLSGYGVGVGGCCFVGSSAKSILGSSSRDSSGF